MINFNQLSITTTPAKLEFSTVKPLMRDSFIHGGLNIITNPSILECHERNIKCTIDSSACRAEEGLKTSAQLMREYAEKGMQDSKEAIHETATEGQMMVHAHKGENVMIELAKNRIKQRPPMAELDFIPKSRPQITWEPNKLDVEFRPADVRLNWDVHSMADIELVRKPSLDITVTQKPSINIQYVGNLDQRA